MDKQNYRLYQNCCFSCILVLFLPNNYLLHKNRCRMQLFTSNQTHGIFSERKHILKLRNITNPKFHLQNNFEARRNLPEMVDTAIGASGSLTSWLLGIDFFQISLLMVGTQFHVNFFANEEISRHNFCLIMSPF